MRDYPKPIKRQLRALAAVAHERDLRVHLQRLAQDFLDWQGGRLDTWELTDRIHKYYTGPSRKLYNQYDDRQADLNVAYALHRGVLKEAEVPPEVLQAIGNAIAFYRSLEQEDAADAKD